MTTHTSTVVVVDARILREI